VQLITLSSSLVLNQKKTRQSTQKVIKMFDFKVGQKYKTRVGQTATIQNINHHLLYPIRGFINGIATSWTPKGKIWEKYESLEDLVELIEDVPTVKGNEMKHKNHEFITAFINGESVQYKFASGDYWHNVKDLRDLDYEVTYRIKLKTKIINGFEVPMPMDKEPKQRSKYYYPCLVSNEFYSEEVFSLKWDTKNFERGVCFSNKEDAIKTAKAMLGIDPNT
jgi:hypothetical protein